MARRTETTPGVGAPPPIGPQSPWPAPPQGRRSLLGWAALAFVLVVAAATGGWLVFGHQNGHRQPAPSTSASAPSVTAPSLPGPVPATTYEAFAALPAAQQRAVMQAVLDRYNAVVGQADRTLDTSLLPQIATGDELGVLQQDFQTIIKNGYPIDDSTTITILQILMSPQPYSFVSVHVQATASDQYLDPKTLQPVGTPAPSSGTSSFSFVIKDGTWKVSEHIQDATR